MASYASWRALCSWRLASIVNACAQAEAVASSAFGPMSQGAAAAGESCAFYRRSGGRASTTVLSSLPPSRSATHGLTTSKLPECPYEVTEDSLTLSCACGRLELTVR
jgi:hypothetical protein